MFLHACALNCIGFPRMIAFKSVYFYLVQPRPSKVTSHFSLCAEMSYKNCNDLEQSPQDTPLSMFFLQSVAILSRDCSIMGNFSKG